MYLFYTPTLETQFKYPKFIYDLPLLLMLNGHK